MYSIIIRQLKTDNLFEEGKVHKRFCFPAENGLPLPRAGEQVCWQEFMVGMRVARVEHFYAAYPGWFGRHNLELEITIWVER
jgi:hypothetical protein